MEKLAAALGLTRETIAMRLEILDLSKEQRSRLAEAWPAVDAGADVFIEKLYSRLMLNPPTATWFRRPETIDRLKVQQRRYLGELMQGAISWPYVLRRLEIGVVHHRVRLTPRWYVATCAHFFCGQAEAVFRSADHPAEGMERLATLFKTILFDAALILDAYGMSVEASVATGESERGGPGGVSRGGRTETAPVAAAAALPALTAIPWEQDDCVLRRQFLDLTETNLATLRELGPALDAALPRVLEEFYAVIGRWPEAARLLDAGAVSRLREQVRNYWGELIRGQFDHAYAATRTRVGVIHEQIGVSPQMYLIGLARQSAEILRSVAAAQRDPLAAAQCLARAVFFDVSFVMDSYLSARAATVLRTEGVAAQLLSHLPIGVAVVNEQFRVRSVNPALLRMLAVDAEVVRHMHAVDLVTDVRVEACLEAVAKGRSPREELTLTYGGRRLSMSVGCLEGATTKGPGRQFVLTVTDVTELARLAPCIDDNHALLADALTSIPAVVWEAEFGSWIMSAVSAPVAEITGYKPGHFLGRPSAWLDLIPDPDRARLRETVARLAPGERAEVVHRLHGAGGVRWLRTQLVRARSGSGRDLLRGFSHDWTDFHRVESDRMQAVTRLAGSIAHEFNGILGVIAGDLWLASKGGGAPSRRIAHAVERGKALTAQLQTFANGMPFMPQSVEIGAALRDLLPQLRRELGGGCELRVEGEADGWRCEVDTAGLGDALQRLVGNARDAMPDGGIVTIRARPRLAKDIVPQPGVDNYVDHVEVEVEDSGRGMAAEVLAKATEPFFTTKPAAAGLGLSVVQGFVKQSHGHLEIESSPDHGTKVRLRFPRLVESAQPAGAVRRRVVVVDDDTLLAEMLKELVEGWDYTVEIFSTPADAMARIATGPLPDVVLCDVVFDGKALGLVFAQKLTELFPEVPVIHMSGYTKESLRLDERAMFVAKPFDVALLERTLQAAVARRRSVGRSGPASGRPPPLVSGPGTVG